MKRFWLVIICLFTMMLCMEAQIKYVVTSSSLNVRQFPSAEAPILGKLPLGTTIEVWWVVDGWAKILYQQKHAYVSEQHIAEASSAAAIAAVQQASQKTSTSSSNDTQQSYPSTTKSPDIAKTSSSSTTSTASKSKTTATSSDYKKTQNPSKEVVYADAIDENEDSYTVAYNKTESEQSTSIPAHRFGFYAELTGHLIPAKPVMGGIGGDVQFGFVSQNLNFLGAGIGIRGQWQEFNLDSQHNYKYSQAYMPIYANDKIFFSKGELSPYLDVSLGGVVMFPSKTKETVYALAGTTSNETKGETMGGLFFSAGLGLSSNGVQYGICYELIGVQPNKNAKMSLGHYICFKIGIGSR